MWPITALLGGIIPLCLRKGHLVEFAAGRIGVMSAIGPNIAPRRLCEAKFWHLLFARRPHNGRAYSLLLRLIH